MRIIKESKFKVDNLKQHVDKHYEQYIHDPRFKNAKNKADFERIYDEIGDALSRKKVSRSDSTDRYVGFIDKKNRRIKYDRQTGDFVVYAGRDTITLHKKTPREYRNILKRDYKAEYDYNVMNG